MENSGEDWVAIADRLAGICREVYRVWTENAADHEAVVLNVELLLPQRWSVLRRNADGTFVSRWPIPETAHSKLARDAWNFLDALEDRIQDAKDNETAVLRIASAFSPPYLR